MSIAFLECLSGLRYLTQQEKVELVFALLISLAPDEAEPDANWESNLVRRVSEIRQGRARGKPAEQLFAELRAGRE